MLTFVHEVHRIFVSEFVVADDCLCATEGYSV